MDDDAARRRKRIAIQEFIFFGVAIALIGFGFGMINPAFGLIAAGAVIVADLEFGVLIKALERILGRMNR